jgi:amidase
MASGVTDPTFLGAAGLVDAFRARRLPPLDAMRAMLARIDQVNPRVNAYVTVVADHALAQAEAATQAMQRGEPLGPLHGVPVAIKDTMLTKGIRTTWGSPLFCDHVPSEDAVMVERLKAAGAIVLGKTNAPEFAAGGHTFNDLFGPTYNPWNLALSAGGSSGGSAAAVATGMAPLATGSDLGGSLRTPAVFNHVVGHRPSPGVVPAHPKLLAFDTLSVDGPIARNVRDVALALSVMAGEDERDPTTFPLDTGACLKAVERPSVKGWRIAWSPDLNGLLPVEPQVVRMAERALKVFEQLGAIVEPACPDFSSLETIVFGTRGISMVAAHADKLTQSRDALQRGLVWNIEQGLSLTPREIARAEIERAKLYHAMREFMTKYDLFVTPGTALAPFPVEWEWPAEIAGTKLKNYMEMFYLTYAISLTAQPVIALPCGLAEDGRPAGLQVAGRRRADAAVLTAAAAFEQAAPWDHVTPPIVQEATR